MSNTQKINDFFDNLTLEEENLLAARLAPAISRYQKSTPFYYGDEARVHVSKKVKLVNTFFNLISGNVYIKSGTFFGNNVSVLTGTHDISLKDGLRKKAPTKGNDIHIGYGVWIASNATILGPCEIGDYAVIAAGSIVLPGKYEQGCLYAGVPAKFKKRIEFKEID